MSKLSYLGILPIAVMALMPPTTIEVLLTHKAIWPWFIILFGFAGIMTLWLDVNPFVKAFSVIAFINCFFSYCPYISHFAYIELILCIYLYVALTYIEDWEVVFNFLWGILIINIIIFLMQFIHKDNLLNFGLTTNNCTLIIGNSMQAKSFMIILFALLLQDKRLRVNKKIAIYGLIALPLFCIFYFFHHGVYKSFVPYRLNIWIETVRLGLQHPITGYGLGMFKALFPTLGKGGFTSEGQYLNAYNFWVQLFFETGIIGVTTVFCYLITLLKKCDRRILAGIGLVLYSLFVHFPDRVIATVSLLILFLAYIDRKEYYAGTCSTITT
jgi:hypothetical protein